MFLVGPQEVVEKIGVVQPWSQLLWTLLGSVKTQNHEEIRKYTVK